MFKRGTRRQAWRIRARNAWASQCFLLGGNLINRWTPKQTFSVANRASAFFCAVMSRKALCLSEGPECRVMVFQKERFAGTGHYRQAGR